MFFILGLCTKKPRKLRRRYSFYRLSLTLIFILIFMIFSTIILFKSLSTSDYFNVLKNYDKNKTLILKTYNESTHYIYIDIGCFNGETVEHFIHFTPNSSLYDIITFEPDPANYELCTKQLKQQKYQNYNITIISKAAWIRNEKVPFQINRGQRSRIDLSNTNQSHLLMLDAIDFSLWLSRLIISNNTKLNIKISIPGAEVKVLRKMLIDDTFILAEKWNIEWTDRSNPHIRPVRMFIQSMLDSLGYGFQYFTSLHDVRKVFQMNGTQADIKKYYDWKSLPELDTYCHYIQRPVVIDPPRTTKSRGKLKKF
ncbi:unnamed protein product [Rotaria sp. Silwood2]|nr:unnamed protein product [Rotaria sp. Silwood2]CAF2947001.1 unnamed protein product [Rotaria sp. Silwood2]CAF3252933.1 unnamed protein product [Rotaria sp. Silwood2]CAF3323782.1 unnamed protein product [Rotaria sp. Silwood2]CAF3939293.1 unnamed protein product [Rotaria sp. Silwood2]